MRELIIGIDWGKGDDALCAAVWERGPLGVRMVGAPAIGNEQVRALLSRTAVDTAIVGERADLARMVRAGMIKGGAA